MTEITLMYTMFGVGLDDYKVVALAAAIQIVTDKTVETA